MSWKDILMVLALLAIFMVMAYLDDERSRVKKYDCSIAEISPDYPVEVKQACRQLRAKKENK